MPTTHLDPKQAGAQITRHNEQWGITLGTAYGPTFKVRIGGEGGDEKPLWDAAQEMSNRLISLFTRGADGQSLFGAIDQRVAPL